MAKRFIDTGLFDDEWFSELSIEGKLFWVYYLTKCDNAGLLKNNIRLIQFQTGIKDISRVTQEIGNRLLRVNEVLYFCPKFIEFQYPGFPKSTAPQQKGACDLLIKAGIMNPETLEFIDNFKSQIRVTQELTNSYGNGNSNDNGKGNKGRSKSEKLDLSIIPESMKIALNLWLKYKTEKGQSYKKIGFEQLISKLEKDYPNGRGLLDAVRHSISNNYAGIYPPKQQFAENLDPLHDDLSQMDYTK